MKTSGTGAGSVSRREFLGQGALGAAALGVSHASRAATAIPQEENPWRYDVESFRRVDPALVHYERVAGFAVGLEAARRFALAADGRVFVAAGHGVSIFSEQGAKAGTIAVGDLVRCVRVAPDGAVFVGLRDRVEVYDSQGKRTARWAAFQGKPFLTGIALAGKDVFVADAGNRVVYRCDAEGRVQVRIGDRNPDRQVPGLVLPSPFLDVEVGEDGLLRVNNPGRHRVETYTRDGDLEQSWGRPGVGIDSFCGCCNPINLGLLPSGRCVTAEKGLPRVKIYGADGRMESVVAAPDRFAAVASDERAQGAAETTQDGLDVAVDAAGRVWVLDLVGGSIQVFRRKEGNPAPTGA